MGTSNFYTAKEYGNIKVSALSSQTHTDNVNCMLIRSFYINFKNVNAQYGILSALTF